MITADEVLSAGNLIPLAQAYEILGTTEPLHESVFALDGSDKVKFSLPLNWQDDVREAPSTFVTQANVKINGDPNTSPMALTKEAILKMTSSIGLTKDYVLRTPGPLIESHLNWWVQNGGVKNSDGMRLLSKDGVGIAFIKSSLSTFPNLALLEHIEDVVTERYPEAELLVDYKLAHTLERTALRLVVNRGIDNRIIESARHTEENVDAWSLGLQFTNSLSGDPETRLNVSGYLFSWWCTNGSISNHATSGNYNRRVQGQDFEEVLEWVTASTSAILTDLDPELDDIAALTEMDLTGELNDVVADVFNQFHVPVPARRGVVEALVDSDDLTGYGLMQAVTRAANDPSLSDRVREVTMRVGGLIPHTISDRCDTCHRVKVA
jgi:hypothetical protein